MDPRSISAFPCTDNTNEPGMSLRDYFAAQAIQGATTGDGGLPDSNYCQLIAKRAYDLADAMLAARG